MRAALRGAWQVEAPLRAGQRDVHEALVLLVLLLVDAPFHLGTGLADPDLPAARIVIDTHLVGASRRAAAGDEHDGSLEAFGLVDGHDLHRAPLALQALHVALDLERQPRAIDETA
jgi:hypothetical protein